MRFLGVDLAWKAANPSGVVALEGPRFPLRLVDGPITLSTHAAVLDWKCAAVVATRRYIERDDAWRAFLRERPRADAPGRTLKALEDRWDAVLCALAAALEHLERDAMRAYTGCEPDAWRRGYVLAPTLRVLESAGIVAG
jgi:predicted RNase H-like nuclease